MCDNFDLVFNSNAFCEHWVVKLIEYMLQIRAKATDESSYEILRTKEGPKSQMHNVKRKIKRLKTDDKKHNYFHM